jgi:hypothetical protein
MNKLRMALAGLALAGCAFAQVAGSMERPGTVSESDLVRLVSEAPGIRSAAPRVWFDAPGDGSRWARGMNYKASFIGDEASFIPFLGSDAPKNYPVTFRIVEMTVGGVAMALGAARFERRGDEMVAERGIVREAYAIRPHEVEQTFVLDRPVGEGAIVVRVGLDSELVAEETEAGIELRNALGGVRYGKATAIDAQGEKCAVATMLRDGSIELVVPAGFAASAAYPLTIDPLISVFTTSPTASAKDLNVDVAYDVGEDTYLVVCEQIYSATDHDILAVTYTGTGTPVPGGAEWIDYTSSWWANPKVANNNSYAQFLVVAERKVTIGGGFVTTEIWGRMRYAFAPPPLFQDAQFQIGSAAFNAGALTHPDVGGDGQNYGDYCVVWQVWNGLIEYRMVTPQSTFSTGWIALASGGKSNPAISKSLGSSYISAQQQWVVVFQHTYSPTDEDIAAARIHRDGTIAAYPYWVDTSVASDKNPRVSAIADDVPGTGYAYLVAYERRVGNLDHLRGMLLVGTSPVGPSTDLTALLGASSSQNQQTPCVDTDGTRFAIGYVETCGIFCQDALPYAATLHIESGNVLGVSEPPVLLSTYPGADVMPRVTSTKTSFGGPTRYFFGWHVSSPFSSDIWAQAALYDGHSHSAGPGNWFNTVTPGCGGLQLTMSGRPALGEFISGTLSGVQGSPLIAISPVVPAWGPCAQCLVIVDPAQATIVPGNWAGGLVPRLGDLVDVQIAIQGADMGAPGGCPGPAFTVSPGVVITIL